MAEPMITCPSCKSEIKLTDSLAAPLLEATRKEYEAKAAKEAGLLAERETQIRGAEAQLAKEREAIDNTLAVRLKGERERIIAEEATKAKSLAAAELAEKVNDLQEVNLQVIEMKAKLAVAQKAQADALRKERELDDARRELDLTVEKRVQETAAAIRAQAKKQAEDDVNQIVAARELVISQMKQQIEDLKRKAEQGSQQLQGEILELELEQRLRDAFPRDRIEPVAKGEHGGDTIQRVYGPAGLLCGTILWEAKRTKNWTDGWLAKLRQDQRAANAEIAVIVSTALPKDVEHFHHIEGIWVTAPQCAIAVAVALRQTIIETNAARKASEGQQSKQELVYQYLTGPGFRRRIEAIVEKFSDMQRDLDVERKAMTRIWAKRETQIRGVLDSTSGLYGDLQGIAGRSMEEIDGLDLPLLAAEPQ